MTIHEASKRYHIPLEILREYERWGLCGTVKQVMGAWQYDDTDLERLSMVMTLHDVGFENDEIETYMKLLLEQEGTETQRLRMLDQKRGHTLDEIHFREKQLERLDYLRYHIRKQQEAKQHLCHQRPGARDGCEDPVHGHRPCVQRHHVERVRPCD